MKKILKTIVRSLPRSWVKCVGRLQFKFPALQPLIVALGKASTSGVGPIAGGVGAGLLFDNSGGYPGYSLGTTEPEEQEAFERLVCEGMTVFNAGANIGFHAVILARLVGPSGHLVCFEPFPQSAAAVRRNLELNGFSDRAKVVESAVSDAEGEAVLSLHGGTAEFSISKPRSRDADGEIKVSTVSLDGVASSFGLVPQVITLDIEGAEIDALRGSSELIAKYRPTFVIELHWLQQKLADFFATELHPRGYRILDIHGKPHQLAREACREHVILSAAS
jgi:FkbM family methyltransferase